MVNSGSTNSVSLKIPFYYDIKHTKELRKTQFYPVGVTVPSRFRYLILPGVNNYIRREYFRDSRDGLDSTDVTLASGDNKQDGRRPDRRPRPDGRPGRAWCSPWETGEALEHSHRQGLEKMERLMVSMARGATAPAAPQVIVTPPAPPSFSAAAAAGGGGAGDGGAPRARRPGPGGAQGQGQASQGRAAQGRATGEIIHGG